MKNIFEIPTPPACPTKAYAAKVHFVQDGAFKFRIGEISVLQNGKFKAGILKLRISQR